VAGSRRDNLVPRARLELPLLDPQVARERAIEPRFVRALALPPSRTSEMRARLAYERRKLRQEFGCLRVQGAAGRAWPEGTMR
jgi:hypothetical protein